MKRSHVLFLTVAVIVVTAVALRIRIYVNRPKIVLRESEKTVARSIVIPEPRDYVVQPQVHPDEVEAGPARIVSLAPSITEIVCALGLCDRLVGRTSYCTHPPGIEQVRSVGALTDANLEAIRALRPDMVFVTTNSTRLSSDLKQLGLRCEGVPHGSLAQVYEAIERVGVVCDRPKTAEMLNKAVRSDINAVRQAFAATKPTSRRVLVILGELPVLPKSVFVAGPGSFLAGLLGLAGQTNAAREAIDVAHGEIPLARLRVVDPEVLLEFREKVTDAERIDLYQAWAAVGGLQAIREQRVRSVGGTEWLSAGPRIAIALHRFITTLTDVESHVQITD